jgi:hypothetical protein
MRRIDYIIEATGLLEDTGNCEVMGACLLGLGESEVSPVEPSSLENVRV